MSGDDQGSSTGTDLEALIHTHVERRAHRRVGLAVGITLGARRWVTSGRGRTRAGGGIPTPRSSFQIGSVTKLFTALLLADAARRGEVALDQPLDSILPRTRSKPKGRAIQLADLATHTSGLPRLPRGLIVQGLRNRQDPYAAFTRRQLLEALSHTRRRPPGGRPRYSNFGAGVLGEALCTVTGLGYGELVAQRIVAPLHLLETTMDVDGADPDIALGHTARRRPTGDWHLPSLAGAGALRSSTRDLLAFLDAHLAPDATPLAAPVRDAMIPRAQIGRALQVGLGWHVLDRRDGGRWWWHNGRTGGFASFVGFDPAAGHGVVVLSNTSRPVDAIAHDLLDALHARAAG